METGMICLWYGAVGNIPSGYVICDGNNSTPDLRDKFIVGAGSTYNVDATGGSVNHTHTFTSDGHFHTLPVGAQLNAGAAIGQITDTVTDTGTTDNGSTLPPYHALCYIMKT